MRLAPYSREQTRSSPRVACVCALSDGWVSERCAWRRAVRAPLASFWSSSKQRHSSRPRARRGRQRARSRESLGRTRSPRARRVKGRARTVHASSTRGLRSTRRALTTSLASDAGGRQGGIAPVWRPSVVEMSPTEHSSSSQSASSTVHRREGDVDADTAWHGRHFANALSWGHSTTSLRVRVGEPSAYKIAVVALESGPLWSCSSDCAAPCAAAGARARGTSIVLRRKQQHCDTSQYSFEGEACDLELAVRTCFAVCSS